MKYYKAFDENLQCKGFQYEVGRTYDLKGKLRLCKNGFHFCNSVADCYEYYPMNEKTRICEVEPLGEIMGEESWDKANKYATDRIRIVKELSEEEINKGNIGNENVGWRNIGDLNKRNCNKGNCNKGDSNVGNGNVGDGNKGDSNKGDFNKGDLNKGNCNKGDLNKGNCNKGDSNKGDFNVGNGNVGDGNEGDSNVGNGNVGDGNEGDSNKGCNNVGLNNIGYHNKGKRNIGIANKGNHLCGIACTKDTPLMLFNKPSKHTLEELDESGALYDIANHFLTDTVKSLDTFDMDVWNELGEEE